MFDEAFLAVFKKENPALGDLEYIEKVLVEGITISAAKKVDVTSATKQSNSTEAGAEVSSIGAKIAAKASDSTSVERSHTVTQVKGLNVQEFLNKISDIKKKANIDSIYVFVDEYSDLNESAQDKFSSLLKSFLVLRSGCISKLA